MSIFKKLIVPVDGSAPSDEAIALAVRLARDQDAKLIFVHVCEVAKIAAMVAVPTVGVDPSYAINAEREAGKDALREACERAARSDVASESALEDGSCVNTVLDIARREAADLIVVGSHGRGGISRAVLGSVAEGILRHATVPVLVTRAHSA